jgi:hypothetical protein
MSLAGWSFAALLRATIIFHGHGICVRQEISLLIFRRTKTRLGPSQGPGSLCSNCFPRGGGNALCPFCTSISLSCLFLESRAALFCGSPGLPRIPSYRSWSQASQPRVTDDDTVRKIRTANSSRGAPKTNCNFHYQTSSSS